jgi:peptidoglycan hydrolase-like amidase
VVGAEMPLATGTALKAQAVAARNYRFYIKGDR